MAETCFELKLAKIEQDQPWNQETEKSYCLLSYSEWREVFRKGNKWQLFLLGLMWFVKSYLSYLKERELGRWVRKERENLHICSSTSQMSLIVRAETDWSQKPGTGSQEFLSSVYCEWHRSKCSVHYPLLPVSIIRELNWKQWQNLIPDTPIWHHRGQLNLLHHNAYPRVTVVKKRLKNLTVIDMYLLYILCQLMEMLFGPALIFFSQHHYNSHLDYQLTQTWNIFLI